MMTVRAMSRISSILQEIQTTIEGITPTTDAAAAFQHVHDIDAGKIHRAFDLRILSARPATEQAWAASGDYVQVLDLQVRIAHKRNFHKEIDQNAVLAEDAVSIQRALLSITTLGTYQGEPLLWQQYSIIWAEDWITVELIFTLTYQEEV